MEIRINFDIRILDQSVQPLLQLIIFCWPSLTNLCRCFFLWGEWMFTQLPTWLGLHSLLPSFWWRESIAFNISYHLTGVTVHETRVSQDGFTLEMVSHIIYEVTTSDPLSNISLVRISCTKPNPSTLNSTACGTQLHLCLTYQHSMPNHLLG